MIEPNNIYLGNSYETIKQIPDKSIDLIYTDIPYEIASGGGSFVATRDVYKQLRGTDERLKKLQEKEKVLAEQMKNAKTKDEYEQAHVNHSAILQQINYLGIDKGIDYKILDEFVRVLKYIYIYMVF